MRPSPRDCDHDLTFFPFHYSFDFNRFGIFQLLVVCTIVDDLVSADDITELIEQFEDYVQSCQMLSMNKL